MFREHNQHQQMHLLSTLDELPPKVREMLEQSWAGTFRREVFARVDEKVFGVLYSDEHSRPNVPVNVLLSLEVLKSGLGWSDEQMYQSFIKSLSILGEKGYSVWIERI